MHTQAHKSRFSESQTHIRLGSLIAYLLNSRAMKIWPGWFFLMLGLAVAGVSYGQDTEGATESSSLCSTVPETWSVRDGIISKKLTNYTYSGTGADLSKPIGGWDKYYAQRIITEKESNGSTYTRVDNFDSLEVALGRAGGPCGSTRDTVFVVGTADIKFKRKLEIPCNVTLASNRGQVLSDVSGNHISDGFALGALLYIDKIVGGHDMLRITGNNVRITGLRLKGPQREVHPWGEHHDWVAIRNDLKNAQVRQNLEVDNCEIFQWPYTAIYVGHGGTACVRNNYIHHNQRWKLGYGIGLQGSAKVSVEENLFAFNRHCVAGTGYPDQEYTAHHNVVLASNNPPFDMHGLIESCPNSKDDSWDCKQTSLSFSYDVAGASRVGSEEENHWHFGRSSQTKVGTTKDPPTDNQIGGKKVHITHNTVASVTNEHKPMDLAKRNGLNAGRFGPIAAVYLRGVPWMEAVVEHNSFAHPSRWGGAYKQVPVNTKKKYNLPYNFNKSGNDSTNGVGNVWGHDNKYRRFFERFGDVFQEKGETTILADGHFSFSSDKWPYSWSAHSTSRLSSGYYGLEVDSDSLTWKIENGKATTKHDLNNPIGEMRSKRFQINKNYVSFRIAGHKYEEESGKEVTRCATDDSKYANQVAMLRAHDDAVIFKQNVPCSDSLVLYEHDLSSYNNNGTWAYFVLSDGDWHDGGWIEVDDIRFFDSLPTKVETEYAYQLSASGSNAPSFSTIAASGLPTNWSSSRQTPISTAPYEWRISRTRLMGGSWSSWGSPIVVSTYTETAYAYRLHTSGTTAPTFSASASGVPSGWSSSRRTPYPHERYEWRISRTRPAGGSWSHWGSATVVRTYGQSAYRLGTWYQPSLAFTVPVSRLRPGGSPRYEWRISRTRLTGGSGANGGRG